MTLITRLILFITIAFALIHINTAFSGTQPKFTISPVTPINIEVPQNGTTTATYRVTNNTKITRQFTMVPIVGINQVVGGAGACSNPFFLSNKQSCLLNLIIDGAKILASGLQNGPKICKTMKPNHNIPDSFLCSQPNQADVLNITITPSTTDATLSLTGSPLGLIQNGPAGTLTINNTSANVTATNIQSNFTGTALDGKVTETSNTCASVPPGGNCLIGFTPGGMTVAQTSFPIKGDNTLSVDGAIEITPPPRAYMANASSSQVTTCDVSAGVLSNCTLSGSNLSTPFGIAINNAETRAYIANVGGGVNQITTCDISSGVLSNCTTSGSNMASPAGIAINTAETRAYISNFSNLQITTCDISVGVLSNCTNSATASTHYGIAINATETRAYLTNGGGQASICDISAGVLSNCVNTGTGMSAPAGIAINSSETRAYIANTAGTQQVTTCDISAGLLSNCTNSGTGMALPSGIALNDAETRGYTTNNGSTTVATCDISVGALSNCSNSGTNMNGPYGIALNAAAKVG